MFFKVLQAVLSNSMQTNPSQNGQTWNSGYTGSYAPSNRPFSGFQPYDAPSYSAQHQQTSSSNTQAGRYPCGYPGTGMHAPQTMSSGSGTNSLFMWEALITSTKQPSVLFTRLIDAIYNYFHRDPSIQGFDPVKYAEVFTALQYPDKENKVRYFYIYATQNNFPIPEAFVGDAMAMYYRCYNISHVAQNGKPILTWAGFHEIMLRDALADPEIQCKRLNWFLASHGTWILDPNTGQPFPTLIIPRSAFPPTMDNEVLMRAKQCQELMNRELHVYQRSMFQILHETHIGNMNGIGALPGPHQWYYDERYN